MGDGGSPRIVQATEDLGVMRIFQQGLDELGRIFELATVLQQGFDELERSLQLGMVFVCMGDVVSLRIVRATEDLGVRGICQQGLNELGRIFELATVLQQGFDELGRSLQLGMVFVASYGEAWS